jgi:hypothetical protein
MNALHIILTLMNIEEGVGNDGDDLPYNFVVQ